MTEPNTPLKALIVPNTGDLSGTWGSAAINPDMTAIDGMLGGVVTLSLSTSASITLTAPTGSITPGAGPVQSQNAVIKLSGTLSGSPGITFPLPGYYIIENNCTISGSLTVSLIPGNGVSGGFIIAPPGESCHIYTDGTTIKYVNMGRVGSYLDIASSTVPVWISACSTPPYLLCDGTVYSIATYPALGAFLGATFGGNGATTFGVPDLRGRYRIPVDSTGARITSGGSGINGASIGTPGGQENRTLTSNNLPASIPYTDPQHAHGLVSYVATLTGDYAQGNTQQGYHQTINTTTQTNTIGITINPGSPNSPVTTVPPALVAGITLIKT